MSDQIARRILASMNVTAIAAPKTYEEAKAIADKLWDASRAAGEVMNKFPKGPMGMTPDEVKKTPEWQKAKRNADSAHNAVRAINDYINRHFKKEYAADRKNRAANRQVKAKASNDDAAKILDWLSKSIGRPTKIPQGWTQGGMDGPAEWDEPIAMEGLTIKKAMFSFNAGYLSLDFEIDGPHGEDFKFSCESDNAQGLIQRFLGDLRNQVQTSEYKMRDAAEEHKGFTGFLSKLGGAQGQAPQTGQQPGQQPAQKAPAPAQAEPQRQQEATPQAPQRPAAKPQQPVSPAQQSIDEHQDPDRFLNPAQPVGVGRQ